MKKIIAWMIFGSKSLRPFCNVSHLLLSSYATSRQATGTLKIHNSGLDCLSMTQFLTLRNAGLGHDPYFGNHCSRQYALQFLSKILQQKVEMHSIPLQKKNRKIHDVSLLCYLSLQCY